MGVSSTSLSSRVTRRVARSSVSWPGLHHRRRARQRAPANGFEPGHQLHQRKRLDDVVVGAGIQARDAFFDRTQRRQRDHGRLDAAAAQFAQHFQPGTPGQHQIEDDGVELLAQRQFKPRSPSLAHKQPCPASDKPFRSDFANYRIVFDDEQVHESLDPFDSPA